MEFLYWSVLFKKTSMFRSSLPAKIGQGGLTYCSNFRAGQRGVLWVLKWEPKNEPEWNDFAVICAMPYQLFPPPSSSIIQFSAEALKLQTVQSSFPLTNTNSFSSRGSNRTEAALFSLVTASVLPSVKGEYECFPKRLRKGLQQMTELSEAARRIMAPWEVL